ncbi:putative lipid II flippase FtsW [Microbulbifer yueqingensis]|uniref:Probable peptidoglycan glycosyltransferase FtsW n=1 Tax=Microbulbifer yueqingensis TaxID=658219 RepID=A0A1G8VGL0_9GAMM|nr:putative lipid II flippase FtsW [Microbulbifer yueqingensis]SDJ64455.1 cell division-specific peptidoglycan biosynthesis regulator FtsW [Microbulbifer yueqingensis]
MSRLQQSAGQMPESSLDWVLPFCVLALASIGVVMVGSASIAFAADLYGDPWYFLKRHLVFLGLGAVVALVVSQVSLSAWSRLSWPLLLFSCLLLLAVLVPGVGREVNGSRRWLVFGPITVQPAEVAKFCLLIFFASFLTRRNQQLRHWSSFMIPVVILGLVALLLLMQPDFGSVVVISGTVLAMVFLAGARLPHTFLLVGLAASALALLAMLSPYRLQRLSTFLDPWGDQFASGYQLTQSLIAFGRGELFGVGLGNSVQKLFYLPEAHTDFIFAILSEEWGMVGGLVVIGLFGLMTFALLRLVREALARQKVFAALLAFGIAVLLAGQAFVNMGVASGLLPTKGLTLPFVSSGGSSLVVCCALFALALRVQAELRGEEEQEHSAVAKIRHLPIFNPLQLGDRDMKGEAA